MRYNVIYCRNMDTQSTLDKIVRNAVSVRSENIKSVLVLHCEQISFIGDSCMRFGKFKHFKAFLNNANIDINFTRTENFRICDALLKNNSHVNKVSGLQLHEVEFHTYDLVFCVAYREDVLLNFWYEVLGSQIHNDQIRLAVFSISQLMLHPKPESSNFIFPIKPNLLEYLKIPGGDELYVSQAEQAWANKWLESKNVGTGNKLFIVLDSTSDRYKMLNISVYFEFLTALLRQPDVKVLIFDENKIGKQNFYSQWLGPDQMEKMIFSEGNSLRDDICLLASKYTRLVMGPCTGLVHCASGIYNAFVSSGMNLKDVPLIVTYTGKYAPGNGDARLWWSNSPLVNCLILTQVRGIKQVIPLDKSPGEIKSENLLPCVEYTADMLIDFVSHGLSEHVSTVESQKE